MPAVALARVCVHLRPEDNVAIATRTLPQDTEISHNGSAFVSTTRISMGHKIAVRQIKEGQAIYKYGQIIGFASQDIPAGAHVHVHNVRADAFARDYDFCRD